jgi:5'-phosphate synthase pdxT subunit
LTKTEKEQGSLKNPLLDPDGPELGDDFLALCGERNRLFVERLRAEEDAARQQEAQRLHRAEYPRIGILAIQGDYAAHAEALAEAGAEPCEVRKPDQLAGLDGLILPGGESTTILKFLKPGFFEALEQFCGSHPVFGTCAGAILLAREVLNPPQRSLGLLDAVVERNAYGRQIDSTILTAETELPGGPLEMVFIRAPRIVSTGPGVEVLALRDGSPVLVREGRVLAATFHPELSADRRIHRLFVQIVGATSSK